MATHAVRLFRTRSTAGRPAAATAPVAPALPPLARGERILATDRDSGGAPVVATTLAIYRAVSAAAPASASTAGPASGPASGPAAGWYRLGWVDVGRVRWDPHRDELVLTRLQPGTPGAPARVTLGLGRRSRLPALARERVASTLLACSQVSSNGRVAAVVQARRPPGGTEVAWVVLFNGAVDRPREPAVHETVRAVIDRMRAEIGL
jgi:hypothetical protein